MFRTGRSLLTCQLARSYSFKEKPMNARTGSAVAKIASLIMISKSYEDFVKRGRFNDTWDAIQSVAASDLRQREKDGQGRKRKAKRKQART